MLFTYTYLTGDLRIEDAECVGKLVDPWWPGGMQPVMVGGVDARRYVYHITDVHGTKGYVTGQGNYIRNLEYWWAIKVTETDFDGERRFVSAGDLVHGQLLHVAEETARWINIHYTPPELPKAVDAVVEI